METGTVIHATLRTEDLIPAFVDEISARIEHGHPNYPHKDHSVATREVGLLHDKLGEIEREMSKPNYHESEGAMYDLDWLFDTLNELAPEGQYFGAHEGDGSDFGFWEVENDG